MKCKSGCARASMYGMDIIAGVIKIDKITKIPFCLEAGGIFVCAFDESEKTGTRDLSPCPMSPCPT